MDYCLHSTWFIVQHFTSVSLFICSTLFLFDIWFSLHVFNTLLFCSGWAGEIRSHPSHGWLIILGSIVQSQHIPAEHTQEGSDEMSAHDTSVSIEMLDQTKVPYPSTAWGWKEIPSCLRGLIIDCMLCTMCPGGRLLGPTSARYWSVVNTRRTWLSHRLILTWGMTDRTLVSMLMVVAALTWKLHVGINGHHPWSCFQYLNHTIIAIMYQRCSVSLMHYSSCLKLGSAMFCASYLIQEITSTKDGLVNPTNSFSS